jgi:hypothetical protein
MYDSHMRWIEEDDPEPPGRLHCPKGHFVSPRTYRLVPYADEVGNHVEDRGMFWCKGCWTLVSEMDIREEG